MNRTLGLTVTVLVTLAAAAGATGCSRTQCSSFGAPASENAGASSSGGTKAVDRAAPPAGGPAAASRAIAEADIVQLDDEQDRIYAMSRSGALAIVDAREPGRLSLLGKTALPGEPFEMYRRGEILLTMSNHAYRGDGQLQEPLPEGSSARPIDSTTSAAIVAVDVRDPARARTTASFTVPGEIADSRIVGNVLYLATYENAACWGCSNEARTIVSTFDVSDPATPRPIDRVAFTGSSQPVATPAMLPWKRSIVATANRLYVGGFAADAQTTTNEGIIEVLDISDPTGHLVRGATIVTAGPILSRWQMDERDGIFHVVSQHGVGRSTNGDAYPDVDTFRVESSSSIVRVGHMTMRLPRQEALKTVRFDPAGRRGYAITFAETDPLFVLDLADPAHPAQRGEVHMPGWMFHLEPRGDRLLGLGLDRTDPAGSLNVSLFDVANADAPSLLQRVSFGSSRMYSDVDITSGILAEDQDRIQKAFRIFDDGVVAVPFSAGGGGCTSGVESGGIQLLTYTGDRIAKTAFLPVPGNPRRAIRRDSDAMKELIAVSDSTVRAFSIGGPSTAPLADLAIGTCVVRTGPTGATPRPGGDWVQEPRGWDHAPSSGSCF